VMGQMLLEGLAEVRSQTVPKIWNVIPIIHPTTT
jgi:hypothetical protein